jgi:hypothetical protein
VKEHASTIEKRLKEFYEKSQNNIKETQQDINIE